MRPPHGALISWIVLRSLGPCPTLSYMPCLFIPSGLIADSAIVYYIPTTQPIITHLIRKMKIGHSEFHRSSTDGCASDLEVPGDVDVGAVGRHQVCL